MSNQNDIIIKISTEIKEAMANIQVMRTELDKLTGGDGGSIPNIPIPDAVIPPESVQAATAMLDQFTNEAVENFARVQQAMDQFNTDEAAAEFMELALSSGNMTSEMVEDYMKVSLATETMSEEAVEDFLKMHQSMQFVNSESGEMGNRFRSMGAQMSYAMNDLPMMFVDIRMGMMGIMNNISPMVMEFERLKDSGDTTVSIMKGLSGTIFGPQGILMAIMMVTMVAPKLKEFFTKSKEGAEEATEANKDYVTSMKSIRELTDVDTVDKQITQKEKDIELDKKKLTEIENASGALMKLSLEYDEQTKAIDRYNRAEEAAKNADNYEQQDQFLKKVTAAKKNQVDIETQMHQVATKISMEYENISDFEELRVGIGAKILELNKEIKQSEDEITELERQRERVKIDAITILDEENASYNEIITLLYEIEKLEVDAETRRKSKEKPDKPVLTSADINNLQATEQLTMNIAGNLLSMRQQGASWGDAMVDSLERIGIQIMQMSAAFLLLQLLPGGSAFTGTFGSFLGSGFGFDMSGANSVVSALSGSGGSGGGSQTITMVAKGTDLVGVLTKAGGDVG